MAPGQAGVHAELKAVEHLESQGYTEIIAVGASRTICEECAGQLAARGLNIP